jgi:hypothetical protein
VGGAWYMVNGGKAAPAQVSKGGKNKAPQKHEQGDDEEAEHAPAAAAKPATPAPVAEAPKPGSRKLGGDAAAAAPVPAVPPGPGALPPPPGGPGAPGTAAAPAKSGEPAAEQPAAPVKRGRYSNSTQAP